jgi:histone deacetylase 1/2
LVNQLRSEFSVNDLGVLHYFLGIEVSLPSSGSLLRRQRKYALDLLARASVLKCTHVTTPMESSELLCSSDGDPLFAEDATRYRSIVGALQYPLSRVLIYPLWSTRSVNIFMRPVHLIGLLLSTSYTMFVT